MDSKMKPNKIMLLIGFVFGGVVAFILSFLFLFKAGNNTTAIEEIDPEKPIYWVAPMDDNYRRDKPGKSPMGMDLVPVYNNVASNDNTEDEGIGTIYISANVINNLGVRTATAEYKALQSQINTVGYVTYDEDKLVHIHPRVDGWIEKLYVKTVGSMVKKGQPLYDLYSPELVNAQEELLLALDRNNQRLVKAAENRLVALQLPLSVISSLKKSRKVLQSITFFAPQNGVIENLKIREGFFVQPGATLMSIGDLSQVWIEAEVFERQAGQVHEGAEVTLSLDYLPGKTFYGQVDYIYPTLDVKTRTVKVRLRFENPLGDFKPNMFAQVTIHTSDSTTALLIPKEALIRTGSQDRVVLALGGGHFKSIAVNVGQFDKTSVEILSGLSEGEKVVSSAQFLLDSESSKSSDFKRMNHDIDTMNDNPNMVEHNQSDVMPPVPSAVSSASTKGIINTVMLNHRMVNISRDAIEKWQRPPATLDFLVDETVEIESFIQGDELAFTFEIRGDDFVITEVIHKQHESLE
jgi:Cu(I)/Ag(I) efflux system membrane fusion protein